MTEQEQQSFDEGISTAAAMVRASADDSLFLALLRLQPKAALNGLAAAIEDTNNKKPPTDP